jgi:outer membrane protein assembly factor BamB
MVDQSNETRQPPLMRRIKWPDAHQMALGTAWVAGVFSLLVAAVLLWMVAQRRADDPLEDPQFKQLKAELAADPQNEELKVEIRALDLTLRRQYFRRRQLTETGGYLLAAGVIVFLVAAKTAGTLNRRFPHPHPVETREDLETTEQKHARYAVAAVALLVAAGAAVAALQYESPLPTEPEALAALTGSRADGDPGGAKAPGSESIPANEPGFPTDEELRNNWTRFRGPGGRGIAMTDDVPTSWDGTSGEGILWKTEVPLPGNNSPIVWEDWVFLSGADEENRQVYCFNADSGELLWQTDVPGTPQSTAEPPQVMEATGYAAPTMTTDGHRVFAIFANGDLAGLDFAGNVIWSHSFGIPKNAYGHASSLAMHENLLLVQMDQGNSKDDLSKLYALDAMTGQIVWQTPRAVPNSWTTPIVIDHDGRTQIITCADPWVIAYKPEDGSELWRVKCLRQDVGPSPTCAAGLVFVANEFPQLTAIRPDGTGDVTESHIVWTGEDGLPDTCSVLANERHVYLLASYGIFTCYNAKEGGMLWEAEFDSMFNSSPSLVGNKIYLIGQEGPCWIVEPGEEEGRVVAESDLGEECVTSPALLPGRIYLRGKEHLFCIGGT